VIFFNSLKIVPSGEYDLKKNFKYHESSKCLRMNPPEIRVTSGQKLCIKVFYIDCFQYLSPDNTKCRKQILKYMWNTRNYCSNDTDYEILPVFAQFLCFWCYFYQFFLISLALRKCSKDGKIPKIILVQGFCPLKTEITRFPNGFRLNYPSFYV